MQKRISNGLNLTPGQNYRLTSVGLLPCLGLSHRFKRNKDRMQLHLWLHCVRLTIKILSILAGNVGVFTKCRVNIGTLGRKAHDLFGKRKSSTCKF